MTRLSNWECKLYVCYILSPKMKSNFIKLKYLSFSKDNPRSPNNRVTCFLSIRGKYILLLLQPTLEKWSKSKERDYCHHNWNFSISLKKTQPKTQKSIVQRKRKSHKENRLLMVKIQLTWRSSLNVALSLFLLVVVFILNI